MVKIYLRRNFSRWYYSIMDIGDVSPACFINSDIQNMADKNIMVYPLCKPVYNREKLIDITYEFKAFRLKDHPFLQDMKSYLRLLKDTEIYAGDNGYADLSTEESLQIVNREDLPFAFREPVYLEVLTDICSYLNLVAVSKKGSDKRLVANEAAVDSFFKLTEKNQLNRVITVQAELFIEALEAFSQSYKVDQLKTLPSVEQIMSVLKNGMNTNDLMSVLFKNLMSGLMDFDSDDSQDWDKEEFDAENTNVFDIYSKGMNEIFVAKYVSCLTARHFFLVYGNYLQLIQPLYRSFYSNELSNH